jgi:hypothetical protein
VQVEGTEIISDGTDGKRTIRVRHLKVLHQVVKVRPVLSNPHDWETITDRDNGVSLRYPRTFIRRQDEYDYQVWNFVGLPRPGGRTPEESAVVAAKKVQRIANLGTDDREIYPNTSFLGSHFSVQVDRSILTAASCGAFASFRTLGSRTVKGIEYSEAFAGDAGGGEFHALHYFHTFQHGLCYEALVDVIVGSSAAYDFPCDVDRLDENPLLVDLLSQIAFFDPANPNAAAEAAPRMNSEPNITSFVASTNGWSSGGLEYLVSWSADFADRIQLQVVCPKGVDISTREGSIDCGTIEPQLHNLPPGGYIEIKLFNHNDAEAEVTLTLQPFLGGVGYPTQIQSTAITVYPAQMSARRD